LKDTVSSRAQGDILGIYNNSAYAVSGMAWVGNDLMMIDMQDNYLMRYDTATRQLHDSVLIHNNPYGMAWDGENLWIGDKSGHVMEYTLEGTPTGASFNCPSAGYSTLAWDGENFLTNFILESNPVIYRVDKTGEVTGSFKTDLNDMKIWQLTWADEHLFSGEVWFTNNSGVIGQIRLEGENGTLVKQFPAPASVSYAIAHDHTDLWYGKTGRILYRVDDGIDEVNWLKADPQISSIPAGSVNGINLLFDAGKFDTGTQHANLIILSNDQDEPEIRVPVDMVVTGISLGPDTSFCGNLSVTLDAGAGFAGYLWSDGSTGQVNTVDSTLYGLGLATYWVDVTDIGGTIRRDSISVNFLDCSSVFEFSSGLKVSVYPNPNHGQFTIQADGLKEKLDITLTDVSGKIILKRQMASPGKEEIEIGNYPKGRYLLRLSSAGKIKVEKVVVW
jgi:hypothetical protein